MSRSDLSDADVGAMLAAVRALLPDPATWEAPGGYRSVGLAVIDAVWSIGVRFQSVELVVARYRAERIAAGADPEADRPGDVRRFIEACGGPEAFAELVRNRQRTSTTNGILKAEAVLHEARILEDEGIATRRQLTRSARRASTTSSSAGARSPARAPASPGAPSRCSSASPRSSPTA